ncbi:hypothetical protein ABT369_56810 [Dactylosporangium sp. NPDC000244]|uniref:hypothetical protein n=1 Tax=Dactylosporangium sp. NPDC000244 TaxID=3154365 RepID=UPI00332D98B3
MLGAARGGDSTVELSDRVPPRGVTADVLDGRPVAAIARTIDPIIAWDLVAHREIATPAGVSAPAWSPHTVGAFGSATL